MENDARNELTPKFRGIYDKAKTGHSPASAIKVACLRCMVCKTKEIKDCKNEICEFHQYRPYRPKRKKSHRHLTASILNRSPKGQIVKTRKKAGQLVSRVIDIPKSHSGRVRVKIEIEPEMQKKG